ncbi:methylmalonyl-CoA epimerase [Fibrella forsythiae]|uniref:Methylmalonyl-CoA epimerase n=1 Tax=Fibrella forsythiae TaxID=2817061 RepID=A0ABS3JEV5_9BACT|nr:methylmalonyl-CoA epimerase [Fibrella forsythiae]MBO0948521.1 methylmalonyl-CoA epimerase [Fibrella forsythiae]
MFTNVEHIGIAVRDLTASNALFASLFNTQPYKSEEVTSEGVMTSFFRFNNGSGQTKIELLVPTRPDSPIATYLEKRGEGIHHLAFEVTDIVTEMARLKAEGFVLLNETPKPGADNKLVCFLHPKTTNGVLIELCQERPLEGQ